MPTCRFTDTSMRETFARTHAIRRSTTRHHWGAIIGLSWRRSMFVPGHFSDNWFDHCEIWTQWRRVAALTSHPYGEPNRAELEAFAQEHGLTLEIHPPERSWYNPGRTWLIVLWPARPGGAGV